MIASGEWRREGFGVENSNNYFSNLPETLYFLKIWNKVTNYKHLLVLESEEYMTDDCMYVRFCVFTVFLKCFLQNI